MSPPCLLLQPLLRSKGWKEGEALTRPDSGEEPDFLNISIFLPYTFVHSHCPLAGAGFQFSLKEERDVTVRDADPHTSWCSEFNTKACLISATCFLVFYRQQPERLPPGGGYFNSK